MLRDEESVREYTARIEKDPACDLYGDRLHYDSLSSKIMAEMGSIADNGAAKNIFEIYARANIEQFLVKPMQFKRVTIYLMYVIFVFSIISSVYHIKVVPTFLAMYETFDVPIPAHLIFYEANWEYFSLGVFSLLVGLLVIGFTIRDLFHFKQGRENEFILRYLVLSGVRSSYLKIIDILYFPIASVQQGRELRKNDIYMHLSEIELRKWI